MTPVCVIYQKPCREIDAGDSVVMFAEKILVSSRTNFARTESPTQQSHNWHVCHFQNKRMVEYPSSPLHHK